MFHPCGVNSQTMGFVVPGGIPSLQRETKGKRCMHRPRLAHRPRVPRASVETHNSAAATNGGSAVDPVIATDEIVATAHAAADAAGAVIRRYFRAGIGSRAKGDTSPVTQADTEAEEAIRRVIRDTFPTHAVLGEEGGGDVGDVLLSAQWAWVIDPIDGTKAFMTGKPTFGTLIAVLRRGVPVFGIIDQPISGERWAGGAGRSTTFNGSPARVAERGPLAECVVHATTPDMFVGLDGVAFRAVSRKAKHTVYGSDCYAYALLASGHVDVVVEADLKPWDFLALAPVIEGAGGVMTDWYGERIGPDCDGRVVAGASHKIVMEVLETLDEGLAPPKDFQDRGPGHVQAIAGFGAAVETDGTQSVSVQIRAEYHDVCEVAVRIPNVLAAHEIELATLVEQELLRGLISVSVKIYGTPQVVESAVPISDVAAAKQARKLLDDVAAAAGVDSTPTLSDVLRVLDRLQSKPRVSDSKVQLLLPLARRAVLSASSALVSARRRTGAALEREALERISKIDTVLDALQLRLADAKELAKSSEAISAPAWGTALEQARAHSHMLAVGFMGVDGGVGIRITLLAREVLRCARAIAERADDAIIAHHALLIEEEGLALRGIGRRIR